MLISIAIFCIFVALETYIGVMATVGIYDSGIGGLTTLARILTRFPGNGIVYLADNLHHPFGAKSTAELFDIVKSSVNELANLCDVVVLACNTASTVYCADNVIRLLPPCNDLTFTKPTKKDVLLMATEGTLKRISIPENFFVAETPELATLIENEAELHYKSGHMDMWGLDAYIKERLMPFKGVRRVILGCSHYPFCMPQIAKVLGKIKFSDGNARLIEELSGRITPLYFKAASVKFMFSGKDETEKYNCILRLMTNGRI